MTEDVKRGHPVNGQVKWFDPAKGFGFVVAEEKGPDILLHANVLRSFGQSTVADDSGILLEVLQTGRGLQATAVLSIEPPRTLPGPGLPELADLDPALLASRRIEPGRVKWFDKAKGFGFANLWGCMEDVFVHIEVLRRSGLADLGSGEAVGLRVIEGRRGRMAVEVVAWEAQARPAQP